MTATTAFTLLPAHTAQRLVAPARVCTETGLLWITVDGDPEDILLPAGACRTFDTRRSLIAYALGGEAAFTAVAIAPHADAGAIWPRAAVAPVERITARMVAWWRAHRPAWAGSA